MILDFTDVINRTKSKKQIEFVIDSVHSVDFEGDEILFEEPIYVDGSVSILDDVVSLDSNVNTKLRLTCSRCLETFIHPINIKVYEQFTNNRSIEDDEIFPLDSGKIDITEIIVDNILSSLPIKKLCSNDCKGLCQHCGKNLNKGTCDCNKDDIDIRLLGLKDLFSN